MKTEFRSQGKAKIKLVYVMDNISSENETAVQEAPMHEHSRTRRPRMPITEYFREQPDGSIYVPCEDEVVESMYELMRKMVEIREEIKKHRDMMDERKKETTYLLKRLPLYDNLPLRKMQTIVSRMVPDVSDFTERQFFHFMKDAFEDPGKKALCEDMIRSFRKELALRDWAPDIAIISGDKRYENIHL